MKDTIYFRHDYNARNDPKLLKLRAKYGLEGLGLYWCIIEILRESTDVRFKTYDSDTIVLQTNYDGNINVFLKDCISFELFKTDGDYFWSDRLIEDVDQMKQKSIKATESVKKRWEKYERNTNVIRTNYDGNTKEDRRGEDRIGEKSKLTKSHSGENPPVEKVDFISQIIQIFSEEYFLSHNQNYVVVNEGKERSAAGKILAILKQKHPDADGEKMTGIIRDYFKQVCGIKDNWLFDNMTLPIILTSQNKINQKLNPQKPKGMDIEELYKYQAR